MVANAGQNSGSASGEESKSQITLVKTGVKGLDDILGGGLPKNRVILAVGRPGCGKSVFGMEFIYRGAKDFGETGVYYSFEENTEDILANARSFGWEVDDLVNDGKVHIGFFDIQPAQNVEVGDFSLEPLFLRIENALRKISGKRLVLDGINNLLAGFDNEGIVRQEVMRLFRWLKEKDITVVVTGERGIDTWSKLGFEEYLSDGLILLDNTINGNFTTRHLRVVKCRGINHGTDEYPFLIGKDGINIVPVVNADFDYKVVSDQYVGTGIESLDNMLGPGGFIKGSTVLVTGSSGTGKSTLSAAFVNAACERGEKAVYFSFEESAEQVIRNMRSIGMELDRWVKQGLLVIHAKRSTTTGLEGHLVGLKDKISEFDPDVAVIDPITAFRPVAPVNQIKLMLIRLNDFLRSRHITTIMTSLSYNGNYDELSEVAMSSLADSWIVVRVLNSNNERNNVLQILKSRGMSHVKQPSEMYFTGEGIKLRGLYAGPDGLLAGAARIAQEVKDAEENEMIDADIRALQAEMKIRKNAIQEKVNALKEEMNSEELNLERRIKELRSRKRFKETMNSQIENKMETEAEGNCS